MALRDDRQLVMGGEGSMELPWGDALKHAPVVLALAALVIYGYLSICYDGFYRELGVDPGDVGLSYAAILARSSGFVIGGCVIILWFAPVLFRGPDPLHPAVMRNPTMARRINTASRLLAAAVVTTMFLQVFVSADDAARDVKAGKPVRPVRPPVPGMSIPLIILAIHADPATVEPAGQLGASPAAERLRGRRLLYLGQAGGTVVFYDVAAQQAVYVPGSSIILHVGNCKGKPPDPACQQP
jgi:hypothetical protein